jgi:hypothetical protein
MAAAAANNNDDDSDNIAAAATAIQTVNSVTRKSIWHITYTSRRQTKKLSTWVSIIIIMKPTIEITVVKTSLNCWFSIFRFFIKNSSLSGKLDNYASCLASSSLSFSKALPIDSLIIIFLFCTHRHDYRVDRHNMSDRQFCEFKSDKSNYLPDR